MNPHKSKRKKITLVIAIILGFIGLFLLLYPSIADYVNTSASHDVIDNYIRQTQKLDQSTYSNILESAREYNAELFRQTPYIAELTAERRSIYNSLLDITGTGVMGYVEIEKIDVYLPIYHGTSDSVLSSGVGHLEGSSLPVGGESVHTILSAHSGLPSARLFTDVDQLEIGDTFLIHVLNETLTYEVENIQILLPEAMTSMQIEEGRDLCSLMTCTPYAVNSHRLLVTGHRIETPEPDRLPDSDRGWHFNLRWHPQFLIVPAMIFAAIAVILVLGLKKRK